MTDTTLATPVAPAVPLDNSRVWLLAAAPLLLLALDAAFLYAGHNDGSTVSWVAAIAVNVGIATWDSRYLKSRGHDVSAGWAAVLVPSYLWRRSQALGLSQAPLAAWLAALVVSVAGTFALQSHFVTLDMPTVSGEIAQWAQQDDASSVSCPSRSVYAVHDSFACSLGLATVLVTVENSSGYITWQLLSG